jgi:hypothetical protein
VCPEARSRWVLAIPAPLRMQPDCASLLSRGAENVGLLLSAPCMFSGLPEMHRFRLVRRRNQLFPARPTARCDTILVHALVLVEAGGGGRCLFVSSRAAHCMILPPQTNRCCHADLALVACSQRYRRAWSRSLWSPALPLSPLLLSTFNYYRCRCAHVRMPTRWPAAAQPAHGGAPAPRHAAGRPRVRRKAACPLPSP